MSLKDYRKTRRLNCFSKVDTLGSFDFYNFIISLDSVEPQHLLAAAACGGAMASGSPLSVQQFQALDKAISLAMHEYTHFVDSSSTLWGLRYMQLLDSGYQVYGNPDGEVRFPAAKQLHDFGRSIGWPEYYTEQYGMGDALDRPWRAEVTGGRVFDTHGKVSDRPIVFVRFADRAGGQLVRSPLSAVSVLEASAMAQELGFRSSAATLLGDAERIVESREIQRQTLNHIYHPELTEYSVCAHLFANNQQCPNVGEAYASLGLLLRWVLNVPRVAIAVILRHLGRAMQEVSGWDPASRETALIRSAVESHDIGALFFLLVMCLPPHSYTTRHALLSGLRAALARLGLDAEQLKDWADAEAAQAAQALSQSPIEQIRMLSAAGLLNYQAISWYSNSLPMPKLHLPRAVLADLSVAPVFDHPANLLRGYDVEKSFEDLYPREAWIHKFAQACF